MPVDMSGQVEDLALKDALSERYLAYALSTIMSRSLPDVRDGLKPVHRRLVFAMHQLKLDPRSGFKKCARVVGDVIGKYHPHGDSAVYEALVRLAQDFAARYPLIEGQGNFGNIDGDNAAAMRYTESRLTAVAEYLLRGIDENAVDFRPTYDGEDAEPVVLPGAFPNLLANGAAGIAVGMATNIPPHNAGELCRAARHLIANPEAGTAALLNFVKGPDFPTGGELVEDEATILAAYETGRGSLRTRARWSREEGKHGTWVIVVTEIPYNVQKSRLVEQIALLLGEKKLPLLGDVRDESAEQIRLVLEPKTRTVDPEMLMASLFRATQLESRFALNMNVLDAGRTPRVMGLRDLLKGWIDHRHEVLVRRSEHRLAAIAKRLEILDGFIKVFLNLDEVIRIIRHEDEPRAALIRAFTLTEVQADAILNMRLRSLRKLEEMEIKTEHKKLSAEQKGLQGLLASEPKRWARISEEILEVEETFGQGALGARRTLISSAAPVVEIVAEALIEREAITVILSEKGWIRAQKGHLAEGAELKFKEGDKLAQILRCESTDKIALLSTNGRVYTIKAADVPRGRGDGQAIRLMAEMTNEDGVLKLFIPDQGQKYIVASSAGRGFILPGGELASERRAGKIILVLKPGEEWAACEPVKGDHVAVIGQNRKLLVFPLDQVPEMPRGTGVQLQKYKDGGLSDVKTFALSAGLTWRIGDKLRVETKLAEWLGARASAGRLPPNGFPRSNRFGVDE
ncbi:DNA topoisomerase IV subunit A [Acidocella sp.]|uniref:DNA topoisomerase IV subunit A n=1 Tax=Acidocella sp. TaxID=50710 RepID=UPI00261FFC2F|nr:DNA topoisomerase IV subunit A [Acidocella sp.]